MAGAKIGQDDPETQHAGSGTEPALRDERTQDLPLVDPDDADLRLTWLNESAEDGLASQRWPEALRGAVARSAGNPEEGERARNDAVALASVLSGIECATREGTAVKRSVDAWPTAGWQAQIPTLQTIWCTLLWLAFLSPAAVTIWQATSWFAWASRLHTSMLVVILALLAPTVLALAPIFVLGARYLARSVSMRQFMRPTEVTIDEKRRRIRYRWVAEEKRFTMDVSAHEVVASLPVGRGRALVPVSAADHAQLSLGQQASAWHAAGCHPPVAFHPAHLRNEWSVSLTAKMMSSLAWFLVIQILLGLAAAFALADLRVLVGF
jgi:hypothetical protein